MGFVNHIPLGNKVYIDLVTTNAPEVQLWQELVMLRHLTRPRGISAKKASAPWIDQAKIYFLDACNSDFRTGGLLYYYSFLNLAKAYLAAKRVVAARDLKSTSLYHGLAADPQAPRKLIDFEISVHPPIHSNKRNLFSTLCEGLTGMPWPHSRTITVRASDVLPYCNDISAELQKFYHLSKRAIIAQSLIRDDGNTLWYELNVPNDAVAVIQSHVPGRSVILANYNTMNNRDFTDWMIAFRRTRQSLVGTSFIRTRPQPYDANNRNEVFNRVLTEAQRYYSKYVMPLPIPQEPAFQYWQFVPQVSLAGTSIHWHPLLSDYLFAFVLSTILRYHPHLLPNDSQASFTAEAWCNQSAITTLRHFLMAFTTPSIRIACR